MTDAITCPMIDLAADDADPALGRKRRPDADPNVAAFDPHVRRVAQEVGNGRLVALRKGGWKRGFAGQRGRLPGRLREVLVERGDGRPQPRMKAASTRRTSLCSATDVNPQ